MSQKDKNLLKCLGLSQKEISDALGRSQQSVSAGIALPADYFDLRKLNLVEKHILEQKEIPHSAFIEAKRRYLGHEPFAEQLLSRSGIPSQFEQLWILGEHPDELISTESCKLFLDELQGRRDLILTFTLPDESSLRIAYQILSHVMHGNVDSPQVYLLVSPISKFLPTLYIIDAHASSPEIYSRLIDHSFARLPDQAAKPIIRIFNEHGFGLHPVEFYLDEDRLLNTGDLSLRYKTDNFVLGRSQQITLHEQ